MRKNDINRRMCAACRERRDKKDFIRIVKLNGKATIDAVGKAQTRGMYLCKNLKCVQKAEKIKALSRHLKCAVNQRIYDELRKWI